MKPLSSGRWEAVVQRRHIERIVQYVHGGSCLLRLGKPERELFQGCGLKAQAHDALGQRALAIDADGAIVGVGDVKAQTRQVLESIRSVLEAAGGSMQDIVFNAIFLKDLSHYRAMNEVYREYFPTDPPARYCIRADLVKSDFLVEIAATAHLD